MPAATSKRVRGIKISRHFIIGNEAHVLPHPNYPSPAPEGHTKGWKVYVRPLPNGPDITTWLKKVQFKLHHTYADASRTIESSSMIDPDKGCAKRDISFEVAETGYGEFSVEIRLYFAPESGEKAIYREHYLTLSPYGDEKQRAKQEKENLVVAERLEMIEFNEPTGDFAKMMMSEDQFNWLKVKKGRGKGKKPDFVFEGQVEPSAQLPEKAIGEGSGPNGAAWSAQYEKQVLAQLEKGREKLDSMLEEEKRRMEQRRKELEKLGGGVKA